LEQEEEGTPHQASAG